ncbi:MAG: hypothetical protein QGI32_12430 [Candidatus Latescibacteria bacterium]|nr:hypothetical protein [Candidatus Latescibacterota bacterium]
MSAILIHPDDRDILFVAVSSKAGTTLCRSTDRGATWGRRATFQAPVSGLFCASSEPERVYAVTTMAVHTLTLDGETETEQALPEGVRPAIRVAAGWDEANDSLRVYAVSGIEGEGGDHEGRGFVSHDGGITWERFDHRLAAAASVPADDVGLSFACAVTSPTKSLTAYAVCDRFMDSNERGEAGTWYGILKTIDGGLNWEWVCKEGGGTGGYSVQDGVVADNVTDSWCSEAFGGGYVRIIDVGVFPDNPDIAVFTDWYRTMKTSDGGASWRALYSRSLPDGSCVSRGLGVTTTYGVHFDPFDPQHIAVSYTDIAYWHTFDGGQTWRRSSTGIPHQWQNTCYWVQFDPEQKDKVWSAWGGYHDLPKLKMTRLEGWKDRAVGGVAVSTDGGQTWQVTSGGLPEHAPTTCVLMDPASPAGRRTLFAAVYGKGVYKSVDDGRSWDLKIAGVEQRSPNAWELVYGADGVLYLVVAFDVLFDDGSGNRSLLDGALYRSTDGAESWESIPLPEGARFPNSLATDPRDGNRLYLCLWSDVEVGDYRGRPRDGKDVEQSQGGLLMSEDCGRSWRQVFTAEAYVYGAAVDPRKPGRVYLVTFHHTAHFSEDYGATWQRMKGYDFYWGHRPVIDPHDEDKLYLTTFGSGFWHGRVVAEEDPAH